MAISSQRKETVTGKRRTSLQRLNTDLLKNYNDGAAMVRNLCEQHEGSVLKAWLKHFDTENEQSISIHDFSRGLRMMGYQAGQDMIKVLDEDQSGEISLAEIDERTERLWKTFRRWCCMRFEDVSDMVKLLGGKQAFEAAQLSHDGFIDGLARLGWENECPGDDELLFKAIDKDNLGYLPESHLNFLTIERRRMNKKQQARHKASRERRNQPDNDPHNLARARAKFKRFLKRKFGGYIRAWRSVLSPGGAMTLQKVAFLKACASCGYNDNLKLLWKAFDKDDSGSISIDELDLQSAEVLADFKIWISKKFGKSASAFRAIDMDGTRRVPFDEFATALEYYDFNRPAKLLFDGLDRYDRRTIVEEDLKFLDDWKPLAFLTAKVNEAAAAALKDMLLANYKTYLKGWRRCLDQNANNHCNWAEFESGCKKLGFQGDVPGAWRALDPDLMGYITLLQIDPVTSQALYMFRIWAEGEFGSIRSAFEVFDDDSSKEITFREFVKCCRIYGFEGNPHHLFHALDINRDRALTYKELSFLEHWVFPRDKPRRRAISGSFSEATKAEAAEVDSAEDLERISKLMPSSTDMQKLKEMAKRHAKQNKSGQDSAKRALPKLQAAPPEEDEEQNLTAAAAPPPKPDFQTELVLVAMERAEPLYSVPPYRLAQTFSPRTSRRTWHVPDITELAHISGISAEAEGGLQKHTDSARSLQSISQKHTDSARSLQSHSTWCGSRQSSPPRGMPTLDDLLLPVSEDHFFPVVNWNKGVGSARRPFRPRGREKLAGLRKTSRKAVAQTARELS